MMNNNKFKGIFAASVTPFTKEGDLDIPALKEEIEYLISKGIDGFFIGGTYGEGPMMTSEEYETYVNTFSETVNGRVGIIAQVGATSLKQTLKQAEAAEKAKVDALAAIPPFYFPHDDEAIYQYYQDLCSNTNLPVYIYNNPERSGCRITPKLLERLAKIPGLAGMKDSSNSITDFTRYKAVVGSDFNMLIGNDDFTLGALLMGADGGVIVMAGVFPELYVDLYNAFKAGDFEKAREIQYRALSIRSVLKKGPYISTYKAVLGMLGRNAGYCRKPIRELTESEYDTIHQGLTELGII